MKHTPGPWDIQVKGDSNGVKEINIIGNRRYELSREAYCVCRIEPGHKDSDANARLIINAPKLLEALKRLMKRHYADTWKSESDSYKSCSKEELDDIEFCLNIISKAEG